MSAIAKTSARLSRILSPLLLGILLAACGANVQSTPPPPVAPTPPGAPTLTLSAQSTSVETGAATTLTWSSTDASACSAGGAWSGAKSTSGTESTGALSATSAFSLDCSGSGGTTSQSVTVTVSAVAAAPTVSLTADPISVVPGDSATLNWSTTNASSCTASGGWMGSKATSGSASTGALNATSTFSLACTGTGGTISRSVTVTVSAVTAAPTVSLTANPTSVVPGNSATLNWSATNASSCTASGGWMGSKATSGSASTGALNATSTFSLACTGTGGTTSQSVTVTVSAVAAAPTVSLTANPTSVASGHSATLNWSTTNASSCTASGGWTGSKAISGSASTGALNASKTYSLACTGAGGTTSQSVTVTVSALAPAPTVSLTANPISVVSGNSATLNWSTTNASSCTASGGWTGSKATSGSTSTGALTSATDFTLTCTGTGGSASVTAHVALVPRPTLSLAANPTTINRGATSTLTWSSTNATTCSASGGWSGIRATSGTESTAALQATTSFTMTCTGAAGTATQNVTVAINAPTLTLTATPTSVAAGQSTSLSWTTTNASSCTASGAWSGARAVNDSDTSGAIVSDSTFTLTCTGPGGSVQKSVLVTVQATGSTLFFDDFLGTSVDPAKWIVMNRISDQVNNEVNCVIPGNITVQNGILSGVSKFEDHVCGDSIEAPKTMHYTSWQIQQATAPFLYGTIEVRAKEPGGTGIWPTIFMLGYLWQASQPATANVPGNNWPVGGWCEIDIAEFLNGGRNQVNNVVHYNTPGGTNLRPLPFDATTRFMVYRLQWTANSLTWSVDAEDGVGYRTLYTITDPSRIPNVPMYLTINAAIGGIGGGTPDPNTFPQTFQVDYVRVTQ